MKNLLNSTLFLLATLPLLSQTDGISYQAVIMAPYVQELPGVDVQGNILPNAAIAIRFTILDADDALEFQEEQFTQTDAYGRINLVIGSANKEAFSQISWDGSIKNLLVEIDFESGGDYLELSKQELLFVPYAYHRNITATGTLKVDGPTELFSSLRVHNNTILEKNLTVKEKGTARFFGKVRIDSTATFYDHFTVDSAATATFLGPVEFAGPTSFSGIEVDGPSVLNGKVTIDYNTGEDAKDTSITSYPLMVQGSTQGIAIKVNGNRTTENNFVSFWDNDQMWGRIEGQTFDELRKDYLFERGRIRNVLDVAKATTQALIATGFLGQAVVKTVAASTSATACVGVGACVTVPIPSLIVESISNTALSIANGLIVGYDLVSTIENAVTYEVVARANIGVTFSSGSGDYAEWLPKLDPSEVFTPGQLVGIKNGHVTRNTWGVEKIMVVSTSPIVLGNMPQPGDEENNVKIAFMGQVPVKVLGKVSPGDYILPDILGQGFATAVHPNDMGTKDYKKVAGVAWNILENITDELSIVNVAVGINVNDLSDVVIRLEEEIKALKQGAAHLENQIARSNEILSELVPGYAEAAGIDPNSTPKGIAYSEKESHEVEAHMSSGNEGDIIYFEIPNDLIEDGIELARAVYMDMLNQNAQINSLLVGMDKTLVNDPERRTIIPIEEHPFWQKMDNDPAYRAEVVQFMQSNLEKAYHTHKEYAQNSTDLKLRK